MKRGVSGGTHLIPIPEGISSIPDAGRAEQRYAPLTRGSMTQNSKRRMCACFPLLNDVCSDRSFAGCHMGADVGLNAVTKANKQCIFR